MDLSSLKWEGLLSSVKEITFTGMNKWRDKGILTYSRTFILFGIGG